MPQLNLGLMKTRKDTMRVLNEFILELVREVEGGFAYKPSNKWLLMVQQHLGLLEKLASHEAMQANMEQLGSDIKGAASKDRVFFMWTYIGETLCQIYTMVPFYGEMDQEQTGYWELIVSRAVLTAELILTAEGSSPIVDNFVTKMFDEPSPPKPEFGEDILVIAEYMIKDWKHEDKPKRARDTWDGLWHRADTSKTEGNSPEMDRLHAELQAARQ